MRISRYELDHIAGYRYGFMIADMVLGDTLDEFAQGGIEEEELSVAIQQHRMAYEAMSGSCTSTCDPSPKPRSGHRLSRLKIGSGTHRITNRIGRQNHGR